MKREDISNAVGGISTRHIKEAESHFSQNIYSTRKRFSAKKMVLLVAAIVICFALAVPALAAVDIQAAYEILYGVSPKIAQELKPVRMSCEDDGIRMEVISACIKDEKADIYISMQDMTGDRIDGTVDLFDSYSINSPFPSSATCEMISYDEETRAATFLISITQMGQKKIDGEKITFSVDKFLSNKQEYNDEVPQIDLSKANLSAKTQTDVKIRGWSFVDASCQKPEYIHCLATVPEEYFSPTDGVTITGVGFIDEKLHIQVYYDNILETDNHGYVRLLNADGDEINSEANISFWDSEQKGSYEEYIFDVSPNEISDYRLFGYFWTSRPLVRGKWQVTFPLE